MVWNLNHRHWTWCQAATIGGNTMESGDANTNLDLNGDANSSVYGQVHSSPKGLNLSDFMGIPPPGDATGIDRLLSSDLGLVPGGPSKSHSTSRTRSARWDSSAAASSQERECEGWPSALVAVSGKVNVATYGNPVADLWLNHIIFPVSLEQCSVPKSELGSPVRSSHMWEPCTSLRWIWGTDNILGNTCHQVSQDVTGDKTFDIHGLTD